MITDFKLSDSGVYVPYIRDERGNIQQVSAAPMWGPQEAILSLPLDEREAIIVGPRGSAKTQVMMLDYLSGVGRGHGLQYKGLIVRPSQREFTDLIKLSEELIRPIWPKSQFNKLKNYWEFPWGETLEFSYFDTPDQFSLFQGRSWVYIGAEEVQLWDHFECYLLLFSCLRSPIPEINPAAQNPRHCKSVGAEPQQNKIPVRIRGRAPRNLWSLHRRDGQGWQDQQAARDLFRLHSKRFAVSYRTELHGNGGAIMRRRQCTPDGMDTRGLERNFRWIF